MLADAAIAHGCGHGVDVGCCVDPRCDQSFGGGDPGIRTVKRCALLKLLVKDMLCSFIGVFQALGPIALGCDFIGPENAPVLVSDLCGRALP
ncbi:hypothetical protein [Novacetimonas hansenii]|uniref:hypothetical protein n=1 Tax=Novacetimonas hansenii TaxID=436 RepID=UPI0023DD12A3|nr:hypothetical protein [Novacetimonas hansenii]WEQ60548.1 hypothetical protein LV563_15155 [Novacetimonas hansenii]